MHKPQHESLLAAILVAASTGFAAAQSTWTNPAPAVRPGIRCCAGLATDLSSGVIWLFSGGTNAAPYPNDTWSWNGVAWTQHSPATSPAGRYGHTMAYDEARRRVVMFGGNATPGGIVNETWEWDGTNWQQLTPATSPSNRYEHAMAYDRLRARTVLFGGSAGANETWEWDGVTWTRMTPATSPSGRRGHSMAFHTASARVVLFGGSAGGDETWEWDGVNWTMRQPAVKPASRIYFSMCEDLSRGRIVMFSGRPSYTIDTWEWDGSEWTQRQPTVSLPGRSATAMAFDPIWRGPLLFGGLTPSPTTRWDETWLFRAASATLTPFGVGCAGSAGVPSLAAIGSPWLGQPWSVLLSNARVGAATIIVVGASDTSWNSVPLPLSLASIGMPGCSLYTSAIVLVPLVATNGSATLSLTVPNDPALAGAAAFFQGLVVDPGINAAGAVASNAGKAVLAGL